MPKNTGNNPPIHLHGIALKYAYRQLYFLHFKSHNFYTVHLECSKWHVMGNMAEGTNSITTEQDTSVISTQMRVCLTYGDQLCTQVSLLHAACIYSYTIFL